MYKYHNIFCIQASPTTSSNDDSSTESPPSDDESFYSATELEPDEPVGTHTTATNLSSPIVSSHRMDQQKTGEDTTM